MMVCYEKIVRMLLIVSFALFVAGTVEAASIETLLMPGKVIAGHEKYETDCTKCHGRSFTEKDQNPYCLDCHKEVRKDVDKSLGFHGKTEGLSERQCRTCHTDHKGRDYDIVGLEVTIFDHETTDFKLEGKHKGIQCNRCHFSKDDKPFKFRDAKGKCYDCHKDDDAHNENLGKKCGDCHTSKSWNKESSFDHDKTDFPLKGAHKKVSCASCHPNERYKDISKVCNDCHSINDVHRGTYGKKCNDCHTEKEWKKIKFDHDKDTDFKLKDSHKEVTCAACHGDDIYAELKSKCVSCHKPDDFHRGRFGEKCEDCHKETAWDKIKFDHDKDTDYKLFGRHKKANCFACHRTDIYAELDDKCISCHKSDDIHKGQEGKDCQKCHNEAGWQEKLRFDHDITKFPLLGMHAVSSCGDCHVTKSYKDAKTDCNNRHEKDDVHKKRLGTACELCHNQNSWQVWRFDHDKQTDFKLDGMHKKNHCYACHRVPVKGEIDLPTTCYQCHEEDDVHMGRFSRRCDKCHTTESFKDIRLPGRR